MARSSPAWQRMVQEGLCASRSEAERWILAGKVRTPTQLVTSAGQSIRHEEPLHVRGIDDRYVSKGGLKLEGALKDFGIDPTGRVCIDAGASTGGFTDCLAQHGAARVYAVDVGFGQLAGSLRLNPTVVNLEKMNIGDAPLLDLDPTPTLGTVDLSYLTLRKAVPQFAAILKGKGDLICLVKPLFEIDDPQARRDGIIADDAYEPLLHDLARSFTEDGYTVRGVTHSPVTGNNGTLEFFLYICVGDEGRSPPPNLGDAIHAAVLAAQALPAYHKA